MSEVALSNSLQNAKSSLKSQITKLCIFAGIILLIGLTIYICFDASVGRDYDISGSKIKKDTSYKGRFEKLVSDVESGNSTGIPTIDDAGVMYGKRIDITKGAGDFQNVRSDWNTSAKTYTWYNAWGDSHAPINWYPGVDQYMFAYSKDLHKKETLYKRSGVVKLFDRYVLVALGTYWSHKLDLPKDQGATYRVFLDNGKSYDVICFDTAKPDDPASITAINGESLGHMSGSNNVVITEFDLLSLNYNYPVLTAQDSKHPEMRYEELMNIKDDPSHVDISAGGSLNSIPEFEGNVIAMQLIDDPKVKDILNQAAEEVKKYK